MMDKITTFLDYLVRMLQVKLYPIFFKAFTRLIIWTNKVEFVGLEQYYEAIKKHPSIVVLWHNRVILGPHIFGDCLDPSTDYTIYVSKSRDGDLLSLVATTFKQGSVIRVPKRAKHASLKTLIKTLKKKVLIVTPDGPRGPKYKVKPGVVFAAAAAKAQIFPLSWSASKTWELKSWDRFKIPKPFGRIVIGFGEPFFVHSKEKTELSEKALKVEEHLNAFKDALNARVHSKKSELKNAPSN